MKSFFLPIILVLFATFAYGQQTHHTLSPITVDCYVALDEQRANSGLLIDESFTGVYVRSNNQKPSKIYAPIKMEANGETVLLTGSRGASAYFSITKVPAYPSVDSLFSSLNSCLNSGGVGVTLQEVLDITEAEKQTLSINGSTLTISDGNAVVIPAGGDVTTPQLVDSLSLLYEYEKVEPAILSTAVTKSLLESDFGTRYNLVSTVPTTYNGGQPDSLFYIPLTLRDTISNLAYESEEMYTHQSGGGFSIYAGNAVTSLTGRRFQGAKISRWEHDNIGVAVRLYFRAHEDMNIGDTLTLRFVARSVRDVGENIRIEGGGGSAGLDIVTTDSIFVGQAFTTLTYQLITTEAVPAGSNRWVGVDGFDGILEATRLSIYYRPTVGTYVRNSEGVVPAPYNGQVYAKYSPPTGEIRLAELPNIVKKSDNEIIDLAQSFMQVERGRYTKIKAAEQNYDFTRPLNIREGVFIEGTLPDVTQAPGNDYALQEGGTTFNFALESPDSNCINVIQPTGESKPHNISGLSNVGIILSDTVNTIINIVEANGFNLEKIQMDQTLESAAIMADTVLSVRTIGSSDAYNNVYADVSAGGVTPNVGLSYDGKSTGGNEFKSISITRPQIGIIVTGGVFECQGCVIQSVKDTVVTIRNGAKAFIYGLYTESSENVVLSMTGGGELFCDNCSLQTAKDSLLIHSQGPNKIAFKDGYFKQSDRVLIDSSLIGASFVRMQSLTGIKYWGFNGRGYDNVLVQHNSNLNNPNERFDDKLPNAKIRIIGAEEAAVSKLYPLDIVLSNTTISGLQQNLVTNSTTVGDGGIELINEGGADNIKVTTGIGADNITEIIWEGDDIGSTGYLNWFGRSYDSGKFAPGDPVTLSLWVKPPANYVPGTKLIRAIVGTVDDAIDIVLPPGLSSDTFNLVSKTEYLDETTAGQINPIVSFRLQSSQGSNWTTNDTLEILQMAVTKTEYPIGYIDTGGGTVDTAAAVLVGDLDISGNLTVNGIAGVADYYTEDSDLVLTPNAYSNMVTLNTTGAASEDTDLSLPAASSSYSGIKLIVYSIDANGTHDNVIGATEILNSGTAVSSITLAANEVTELVCMRKDAITWTWVVINQY